MIILYWNISDKWRILKTDMEWTRIEPLCNECEWIVPGTIVE